MAHKCRTKMLTRARIIKLILFLTIILMIRNENLSPFEITFNVPKIFKKPDNQETNYEIKNISTTPRPVRLMDYIRPVKLMTKHKPSKITRRPPETKYPPHCQKLHFADPPLPVTALASFPGSGNTWMRHLVQEATGLITGTIYPEKKSYMQPGEGVVGGKVVFVKTHKQISTVKNCTKAIVLIRNPFNAILAEANRRITHSKATAPTSYFKGPKFAKEATSLTKTWFQMHNSWLRISMPTLVVRYEDLKANTVNEIKRVINFLNVSTSEKYLDCMMKNQEGPFHRKPWHLDFNPYSTMQMTAIKSYGSKINELLSKRFGLTVDIAYDGKVNKD